MNQRPEAIINHPALIPITGNYDRKPRTLDRDVTIIGRARGSDLCLEANEISTLHCTVYRTAEGFRIRDCSSRTGTRINGESIKNQALRDGDVINLGPFSFELRIPRILFPKEANKVDPLKIAHWKQSRRKIAEHALKLRQRLQAAAEGTSPREAEWAQKAKLLKEKIRAYDSRNNELETAERELQAERDKLAQEQEAHREHVQHIESGLADRLAQTDQEIHQRWQAFQQRCQVDEARLSKLAAGSAALPPGDSSASASPSTDLLALNQLQQELDEQQKRLHNLEELLTRQQNQLHSERQEFLAMKDQWGNAQVQSVNSLEDQKAALAQQEAALRTQKTELLRMMGDLKKMQEDLRKQPQGDTRSLLAEVDRLQKENAELRTHHQDQDNMAEVHTLLEENEKLRQRVDQLEQDASQSAFSAAGEGALQQQLESLHAEVDQLRVELRRKDAQIKDGLAQAKAIPAHQPNDKEVQQLHAENALLKKLLQEKELALESANDNSPNRPKSENDLERYETELNDYRRQLESDRTKLNQEVELLRERNRELDEAIREMEMEMSKERAELARERTRLERMRDELKADMERMQRETAVRDSMAPVHKLREEITGKQPPPGNGAKALNDRLKSFRNQMTDSAP